MSRRYIGTCQQYTSVFYNNQNSPIASIFCPGYNILENFEAFILNFLKISYQDFSVQAIKTTWTVSVCEQAEICHLLHFI